LSSNELIGEATLKLKKLISDCKLVKRPMCFDKKYHKDLHSRKEMGDLDFDKENSSRFWLEMQYKNSNSKKKKEQDLNTRGKVKIQIDVLTAE